MTSTHASAVAHHHIVPGAEQAFEDWLKGISVACAEFPGFLESTRERGPAGAVSISFSFSTRAQLDAWMASEQRHDWLAKVGSFASAPPVLELWRSSGPSRPPSYKTAVVVFVAIWPLVTVIPPAMMKVLGNWPWLAEQLTTIVIVLLMTYVMMPLVTRLARRWLMAS